MIFETVYAQSHSVVAFLWILQLPSEKVLQFANYKIIMLCGKIIELNDLYAFSISPTVH